LIENLPAQAEYLAMVALGIALLTRGNLAGAVDLFTQALDRPILVQLGEEHSYLAYWWRSCARVIQEQFPAALDDLERAIKIIQARPQAYIQRGLIATALGQPEAALADLRAALQQIDTTDNQNRAISVVLHTLIGQALDLCDEDDSAVDHYLQARQLAYEAIDPLAEALVLIRLGDHYRGSDQIAIAEVYYEQALELCRQTGWQRGEVEALAGTGLLLAAQHLPDDALAYLNQALAIAEMIGAPALAARQLLRIGAIQLDLDQELAYVTLKRALDRFISIDSSLGQAQAQVGIALIERQRADCAAEAAALVCAVQLFEQIGATVSAAQVRSRLNDLKC
jgi:tetratricopeptide (TPR) repeat protein